MALSRSGSKAFTLATEHTHRGLTAQGNETAQYTERIMLYV